MVKVTCLLVLSILASIKASNFTEGIVENSRFERSASLVDCTNKYGFQCHADCTTIMVSISNKFQKFLLIKTI